jgi:hypothetical protein
VVGALVEASAHRYAHETNLAMKAAKPGALLQFSVPPAVNAAEQAVEAALEHDVEREREIAPTGQFDELQDAAIERGHGAVGPEQSEIGLKQEEQVERAEREAAGGDPHAEEGQPGRPMKQTIKELQKRYR